MGKRECSRREFLKQIGIGAAALGFLPKIVAGQLAAGSQEATATQIATTSLPDIVVAEGKDPAAMVRTAIEHFGGISRFVKTGDIVVIKPNIGWDRLPVQAANTNPDLVAALVRLALESGAKVVKVFDNPVNNAMSSYKRSGIEEKAKAAGAQVTFMDERLFTLVRFPGATFLKEWPVYRPVLECDCLINVPIAKHHNSSGLTMALKNHMGAIGGNRGKLHTQLQRAIAELALKIKPRLTVLDAYRIMVRNGPTGGSLEDVKFEGKCIVGTDQVAVDAYGASLFGMQPEQLEYLVLAKEFGLGEIDLRKLQIKKVQAA
jgi:uncharacterized protein (DUF362 family)